MNIVLFFGGNSYEHEVSLSSSAFILEALIDAQHTVIPIAVTKDGVWNLSDVDAQIQFAKKNKILECKNLLGDEVYLVPHDGLYNKKTHQKIKNIDCAFIMIHGKGGEDGILQAMLYSAKIPFTGCSIESSIICINKVLSKQLIAYNIPSILMMPYNTVTADKIDTYKLSSVKSANTQTKLQYPLIIKPADGGSSVGIHKVYTRAELLPALKQCAKYTHKIMIEQLLLGMREIEIAVMGSVDNPVAYTPGEIKVGADGGVYTYDKKYNDNKNEVQLMVPAHISDDCTAKLQKCAIDIYKTLNCNGFARVDFFLLKDKIYFNEINTIPGCTSISLFPRTVLHTTDTHNNTKNMTRVDLVNTIINLTICR